MHFRICTMSKRVEVALLPELCFFSKYRYLNFYSRSECQFFSSMWLATLPGCVRLLVSFTAVLVLAATCFTCRWHQRLEELRWNANSWHRLHTSVLLSRLLPTGFFLDVNFPSVLQFSKTVLSLSPIMFICTCEPIGPTTSPTSASFMSLALQRANL